MAGDSVSNPQPCDVKQSIADYLCYTHTNLGKLRYVWTINNFSLLYEDTSEALKSPTFTTAGGLKWCLEVSRPNYASDYGNVSYGLTSTSRNNGNNVGEYLRVVLRLVSCNKPKVRAKFKFSILDAKRKEMEAISSWNFFSFTQGSSQTTNLVRRAQLINEANRFLPGDKLTILCVLSFILSTTNISEQGNFEVPKCQLSDDLEMLFKNKQFSDVILTASGKEIQAHKGILVARSPVFAAMFDHEMKERECNRVEITDMDHEVLSEIIRFIYTDKVGNINKIADKLLAAADKYQIKRLKVMCEEELYKNLSIENAAHTLLLADLYRADVLEAKTKIFIVSHVASVMKTEGWKSVEVSRPCVVAEILRTLTA